MGKDAALGGVSVRVDSCSYKIKEKTILSNVSCTFASGQMTALMGPSGAGKSSLLNLMMQTLQPQCVSGRVTCNGTAVTTRTMKLLSNFVHQDDVLLPSLTVRQQLEYSAALRIPLPRDLRAAKIQEVLEDLGMESCADTKNSNLSGGQRKRCSIAQELLTEPSILFVDEPTSGLDSKTALDVVKVLQRLSRSDNGIAIVVTIHQPSAKAFLLFDRLVLLSKGRVAFNGPIDGVTPFLETSCGKKLPPLENVADFVIDTVQEDPDRIVLAWDKAKTSLPESDIKIGRRQTDISSAQYGTSFFNQLRVLASRTTYNSFKDAGQFQVRFGATIFVGLLLGCIYFDVGSKQSSATDTQALLFCTTFFSVMDSLLTTLVAFPIEKACITREYKNGYYRVLSYTMSKYANVLLLQALYSSILGLIIHPMAGLHGVVGNFCITIILLGCVGSCLGLLIGTVVDDITFAQTLIPPLMLPLILFSGFLQRPQNISNAFKWIYHASFFQYGFQSMIIEEFQEGTFENCTSAPGEPFQCPFGPGLVPKKIVIESFGYHSADFVRNLTILLAYIVLFVFLGHNLMKINSRKRQ